MENLQKHNELTEKIRLILQTLVYEEVIKPTTFDSLQKLFKDITLNYPKHHDFFKDILKQGIKVPRPGNDRTSTSAFLQDMTVLTGVVIDSLKYEVTIKRID